MDDEREPGIERAEIREKSVGTRPVGDVTNVPFSGGGAEETEDGLDEVSESVRHAAEDLPDEPNPYLTEADDNVAEVETDEDDEEDTSGVPVFDRAGAPDKPI
jgi:hypothetical protein